MTRLDYYYIIPTLISIPTRFIAAVRKGFDFRCGQSMKPFLINPNYRLKGKIINELEYLLEMLPEDKDIHTL